MAVGLLWGMDTNIRYSQYQSTQISTQETSTYSPTYAPQYSMAYNPQLILGSPRGSIGGGSQIIPTVAPQVITIPSTDQVSAPVTEEAPMGGGGIQDMLIAGVAIVAAVLILPSLIKGFTKIKTKGLK